MKNVQLSRPDGTNLQCYLWDEVENPKGVIQISHGMAEHATRYDNFASYLNKNGYIVFADDHRAHGETSKNSSSKGVKGYHAGDIYADTVADEVAITSYLKEQYNLPVIYFGHSYGSMLGQRYIEECGEMAGTVLSGSAMMKGALLSSGCLIANMMYGSKGGEVVGTTLDKLSFGSYNKRFKDEGSPYAWLSRDKEQVKKYEDDEECGYVMSIAFYKYFLNGLKASYNKENLAKIDKNKPIAIFSGDQDPVGGFGKLTQKLYDLYKSLGVNDVSIKLYQDARHEIINEINNAEVYADLLATFNQIIG